MKDFKLPCGKKPLFVGGKGVLVLRDLKTDALSAKVYPVASAGSVYRFTHRDGTTRSLITTDIANWKTGAVKFPPAPGHNYRVTDAK